VSAYTAIFRKNTSMIMGGTHGYTYGNIWEPPLGLTQPLTERRTRGIPWGDKVAGE